MATGPASVWKADFSCKITGALVVVGIFLGGTVTQLLRSMQPASDSESSAESSARALIVNPGTPRTGENIRQTMALGLLECVFCYANPTSVACVPCGHEALCDDCAYTIMKAIEGGRMACFKCPICQAELKGNLQGSGLMRIIESGMHPGT